MATIKISKTMEKKEGIDQLHSTTYLQPKSTGVQRFQRVLKIAFGMPTGWHFRFQKGRF
jgi:hypothetical protein